MQVGLVGRSPAPASCRFDWLGQALTRMGHQVLRAKSLDEARTACDSCRLAIFEQNDAGFSPAEWDTLAAHKKSPWVEWWFNLAVDPLSAEARAAKRRMDLVLIHEFDRLVEYQRLGVKAEWIEQACPSEIGQAEHNEAPDWDVLVLAGPDTDDLRDLKLLRDEGYAIGWCDLAGGNHAPQGVERLGLVSLSELPDLASRAAVVLGVDPRHQVAGYVSDAEILALGAGACLVRPFREGLPTVSFFSYKSQDRLLSLMTELRQSVETRRAIGELARRQVLQSHTFEHRIHEVLTMLGIQADTQDPAKAR